MSDIGAMFSDAIGLFSSDTASAVIIFFTGFLIDHVIMCLIQTAKGMRLQEKIIIFFRSFFFMPSR